MNGEMRKPRVPKRFYFITMLIFIPVIFCLAVMRARWYGFAVVAADFALLMWMRHTSAWFGLRVPLCFALSLMVALGGLYFARPRADVSLPGQISSGIVRAFVRLPVDDSVRSGESFSEESIWKPSEGYTYEVIKLQNLSLEAVTMDGSESRYAVLMLHGGAFVGGMNDLYRAMEEHYCELSGGAAVYAADYRLYPKYAYPSQQNDAMDAWVYITGKLGYKAGNVFVVGDSAGGNLALNLGLRLRDAGEAMPAAFICMSPWADLSNSGASHVFNATADPTFGVDANSYDGITPVGVQSTYADGLNAKDPYLSPTFGDYAGFPPMLMQAGEPEVLLSDSMTVRDNAVAHGVDCTLTVYPGMFHVFQGSLMLLPESREAWGEVTSFVNGVIARGSTLGE